MEYLRPLVGSTDSFGIMDNFDTDRMARHVAELFGTPSDYMKPKKDVEAARVQKSKAMSGAQTTSTIANAAAIAKTLTEAHTDRPNVLTDLWKMIGGNLGDISNLLGGQAGQLAEPEAQPETETDPQADPSKLPEEMVEPQSGQPEQETTNAG